MMANKGMTDKSLGQIAAIMLLTELKESLFTQLKVSDTLFPAMEVNFMSSAGSLHPSHRLDWREGT